jgi:mono/diheme cytochrome c family protein
MHPARRALVAPPALLGLLALGACSGRPPVLPALPAPAIGPVTMAEARESYRRACASCHGETARGDGPVASSLVVPPPDLTRLAARHGGAFPFDHVVAVISGRRAIPAHGTREMPVWSRRFDTAEPGGRDAPARAAAALYAERRLQMLARYLASLQREDERPAPGAP